ncbi:MAG: hypothetical protein ABWY25_10945 [Paenisporosarcina sp.]
MSDQSEESGEDFVRHFGILGMKWGVRRDLDTGVRPIAKSLDESRFGKAANRNAQRHMSKQNAKADKKFIKEATGAKGFLQDYNSMADKMNSTEIRRINNDPRFKGHDLSNRSPLQRAYYDEYSRTATKALNEASRRRLSTEPQSGSLRVEWRYDVERDSMPTMMVIDRRLEHASTVPGMVCKLELTRTPDGHITKITIPKKLVPGTISHDDLKHREISAQPWSNYTKADYTPEQWHSACLIHIHDGAPTSKDQCKLPVKTPSGVLNKNGIHAAAAALAGARGGVQASSEQKSKAAAALIRYYRELGDEPPDSLLKHSANEAYLEHYGVKGMKWGVRREREDISDISTEDLKKTVERMRLEKQYREITKDPRTEIGKKQVARIGNMFFAAAASLAINYVVQNSIGRLLEKRKHSNQMRLFKV